MGGRTGCPSAKTLAMTEKPGSVRHFGESVRQLSAVTDNTTKSKEQIAVTRRNLLASESTIKHIRGH